MMYWMSSAASTEPPVLDASLPTNLDTLSSPGFAEETSFLKKSTRSAGVMNWFWNSATAWMLSVRERSTLTPLTEYVEASTAGVTFAGCCGGAAENMGSPRGSGRLLRPKMAATERSTSAGSLGAVAWMRRPWVGCVRPYSGACSSAAAAPAVVVTCTSSLRTVKLAACLVSHAFTRAMSAGSGAVSSSIIAVVRYLPYAASPGVETARAVALSTSRLRCRTEMVKPNGAAASTLPATAVHPSSERVEERQAAMKSILRTW